MPCSRSASSPVRTQRRRRGRGRSTTRPAAVRPPCAGVTAAVSRPRPRCRSSAPGAPPRRTATSSRTRAGRGSTAPGRRGRGRDGPGRRLQVVTRRSASTATWMGPVGRCPAGAARTRGAGRRATGVQHRRPGALQPRWRTGVGEVDPGVHDAPARGDAAAVSRSRLAHRRGEQLAAGDHAGLRGEKAATASSRHAVRAARAGRVSTRTGRRLWRSVRVEHPAHQVRRDSALRRSEASCAVSASAVLSSGGQHEPVADVADGADQRLVLGAELGAQAAHVHVDGAGAAEVVVAPDLLQQLLAAEDPARVLGEELEELELLEGQVERAAADLRGVRRVVDHDLAASGSRGPRGRRRRAGRPARPIASRIRASSSAGPQVCRTTSSMPQSWATTARPPSVTMSSTGTSEPVVRISRHRSRASARSWRPSTSSRSESGASSRALPSAGRILTGGGGARARAAPRRRAGARWSAARGCSRRPPPPGRVG